MDETTFPDERLELIFTCCHPALAIEAQVALTLRTLGGLTTAEIARAFLVPEATMAQRLVRAKRKIKAGRDPLPRAARPPAARPAGRGAGGRLPDLQRGLRAAAATWPAEAIRLGRALAELMPDEPEVHGLLALMLLHDARRDARFARRRAGAAGRPGPRAVGRARRSPRAARRSTGRSPCAAAAPTCCRRRSPRCTPTSRATGADRRALRRARAADRLAGGRAEPRRRGGRGRGAGGGAGDRRRASRSTTTATCTRPAPSCCAGSAAPDEARAAYRRALELAHDDAERRLLERRLAELG